MKFEIQVVSGPQLTPWFDALAKLRIEVFHEFPYLYQGDIENEKEYLATYLKASESRIILALKENEVVGASTCIRLDQEVDDIKKPLESIHLNPAEIVYFGESVIKKNYRGHRLGHFFFDKREELAKEICPDLKWTCFCAVERPEDHPNKPDGYRPLHEFWNRMGYERQQGLFALLKWKDTGESQKSEKPLSYWLKPWK